MSNVEPPAIARPVIRTIVVPASLYSSMISNGLHLMDLTVYDKLRKAASLEDVAVFAALNDSLVVGGQRLATANLENIMTLGSGNAQEMYAVLGLMSKTEEILKLAINSIEPHADPFEEMLRLRTAPGISVPVKDSSLKNTIGGPLAPSVDLPYQLKTSGSNVFIVVGPGFNKYVGAPLSMDGPKAFVRDFLEVCTELFSSVEVARHPLFKSFLYTLAD